MKSQVILLLVLPLMACAPALGPFNNDLRSPSLAPQCISPSDPSPKCVLNDSQTITNDQWACTQGHQNNVLDRTQSDLSSTNDFQVCYDLTNPRHFRIRKNNQTITKLNTFCAYPMRADINSKLRKVEASQCFNITNDGFAEITFANIGINYMIILEYKNLTAMEQCLLSSLSSCPTYSEGFVQ